MFQLIPWRGLLAKLLLLYTFICIKAMCYCHKSLAPHSWMHNHNMNFNKQTDKPTQKETSLYQQAVRPSIQTPRVPPTWEGIPRRSSFHAFWLPGQQYHAPYCNAQVTATVSAHRSAFWSSLWRSPEQKWSIWESWVSRLTRLTSGPTQDWDTGVSPVVLI